MNPARLQWKVGLFVAVGLGLIAALMLQFSKGTAFFRPTYELIVKTPDVGGLQQRASVLMAGVRIGSVVNADLSPDGKSVLIRVRIFKRYCIHKDAQFKIEQSGFLGDQFISIISRDNKAPPLVHGDVVLCEAPFNLQDAAHSAVQLIQSASKAVDTLDTTVRRVDQTLLSEQTLTNLASSLTNLPVLVEKAASVAAGLDRLVASNETNITITLSNLVLLSTRLKDVSIQMEALLSTNRAGIADTIQHLSDSAARVNQLLAHLQAGQGLAGSLLKDEQLNQHFSLLVSNLSSLSSNLNRFGLFYKPKKPRGSPAPSEAVYTGRNP